MILLKNIYHSYNNETVLSNISLKIEPNTFTILTGESGSGKSTLLSIMSTLLTPNKGEVYLDNININHIINIDKFRNKYIGFVFQFHYLIKHLTIFENILLVNPKKYATIDSLLKILDIQKIAHKYPNEISGGQRQRAAIARAIINNPKYIFADEPTGNLDSKNSKIVFDLLRSINATVIIATHETKYIKKNDNVITLKDGLLC